MVEPSQDQLRPQDRARRPAPDPPNRIAADRARILLLQRCAGNRAVAGALQSSKVQATAELAILFLQAIQRGQPMTALEFPEEYRAQAVGVQTSILKAMKAVVYWCKTGCLHLTKDGPEIVRPCPAVVMAGWIPNLYTAPTALARGGLESLAPRDLTLLPTIPQEYLELLDERGAEAPSASEGGSPPGGTSTATPPRPQSPGGGAEGSGKVPPIVPVRGPDDPSEGGSPSAAPTGGGPGGAAPGDIPRITQSAPAQPPDRAPDAGPSNDSSELSPQGAESGGPLKASRQHRFNAPGLSSREAYEVAVHMITNHIQGQSSIVRGLRDPLHQRLAMEILGHMMMFLPNLTYWINYGMAVHTPDGRARWVRPAPAHAIAMVLGIGPPDLVDEEMIWDPWGAG